MYDNFSKNNQGGNEFAFPPCIYRNVHVKKHLTILLGNPVLVVKDMEIAKRIMVKDFEHFVDREFFKPNPKSNKHASMFLTALKGKY